MSSALAIDNQPEHESSGRHRDGPGDDAVDDVRDEFVDDRVDRTVDDLVDDGGRRG